MAAVVALNDDGVDDEDNIDGRLAGRGRGERGRGAHSSAEESGRGVVRRRGKLGN